MLCVSYIRICLFKDQSISGNCRESYRQLLFLVYVFLLGFSSFLLKQLLFMVSVQELPFQCHLQGKWNCDMYLCDSLNWEFLWRVLFLFLPIFLVECCDKFLMLLTSGKVHYIKDITPQILFSMFIRLHLICFLI